MAIWKRGIARDLSLTDYPARSWVPPRRYQDQPVLDVLIVGAGQGGLAVTFHLLRERVSNIMLIDQRKEGEEGPWTNFARMLTLRTPKYLTGPDLGIPSLTPRAWYEAKYGADAWDSLDKIPRETWHEYIGWYRSVLKLPVRNEVRLTQIVPVEDLFQVTLKPTNGGAEEIHYARKVVLATGTEGSGRWSIPPLIEENLPRDRYAHTAQRIDFNELAGKKIGVLGAGASAFDNAATALEHGAAEVSLFARRHAIPAINPFRWMEFTGFLHHFADLDDAQRWEAMVKVYSFNQPPPRDTLERVRRFENFRLHLASPWVDAGIEGGKVWAKTPDHRHEFDFVLICTGHRGRSGAAAGACGIQPAHSALARPLHAAAGVGASEADGAPVPGRRLPVYRKGAGDGPVPEEPSQLHLRRHALHGAVGSVDQRNEVRRAPAGAGHHPRPLPRRRGDPSGEPCRL